MNQSQSPLSPSCPSPLVPSPTPHFSETASPIAKITQGHGNPGDAASSATDPDVSFRVLDNGKVERTNSRYGSVSIIDPMADYQRKNRKARAGNGDTSTRSGGC